MRAIDTNVLVRILAEDDLAQLASAAKFIQPGAWISDLALAEAVWVLGANYKLTPAEQARAIEMLLDHQELVLQNPEAVKAALQLFRSRPALGFSDCLILELARQAGHLPLGTFDRSLAKAAGAQKL
ncbi:MAG TPA: type II toxin-antitoxin system VapC family toxin [Bryobacteraceae bacterium]|nr:type II toxin-antitoxin system VapC family toxin [Bryobacteraceae bacterium]